MRFLRFPSFPKNGTFGNAKIANQKGTNSCWSANFSWKNRIYCIMLRTHFFKNHFGKLFWDSQKWTSLECPN